MTKDLTVQELYDKLEELIEKGFGDNEIRIRYDSDTVYTTLPKSVDPVIGFDYVVFSDYRGVRTNNKLEAAKKLAEQFSNNIPYEPYYDKRYAKPDFKRSALNCTDGLHNIDEIEYRKRLIEKLKERIEELEQGD